MKKIVIRFGIYSSVTICVLFLLAWFLGDGLDYSTQEIIGYASMVVSLCFVFLGIKHFRDKENNGFVSFGQALLIGILISLMAALAFGFLDLIYIEYINPEFMEEYYSRNLADLKASLPPAEFEQQSAALEAQKEMFMNPWMSFLVMSLTVFVIGFIISLISALILQRKN